MRLQKILSLEAPCALAALHHPVAGHDDHRLVVCDTALDSLAAVELVRTTLQRLGLQSSTPVLCLLRDPSHLAEAQARATGATATLSAQVTPEVLRATVRRLLDHQPTRSSAAMPQNTVAVGLRTVGELLGTILDPRAGQSSVTAASLDRASDVLIGAIAQSGIQPWLDVVWTYDDATYQHCMLVAGLTAAFALELGLQPRSQNLLSQAALLHDIGKAQIPRVILNKAGPLSFVESQIMRSHPARGHAMLAGKRDLDPIILDVVRHHHELLDGSGYPDRLQAPQIARMVRIVTICDIYAALIERRAYKTAWSPKDAFAQMKGLGSRLDTRLVDAFRTTVMRQG